MSKSIADAQSSSVGSTFDVTSKTGQTLRVSVLTPDIVRVQMAPHGAFSDSLNIRWGFVRDQWPPVAVTATEDTTTLRIATAAWTISVDRQSLQVSCLGPDGRVITGQAAPVSLAEGKGPIITHTMPEDEHVYGFGFQRVALDARGQSVVWARRFRHQGATAPFFMSSRGYGFFSNNTWEHTFDFSNTAGQTYTIAADGGQLDYYLIHGPSFRDTLRRYTDLSGRTMLVPRWAMGLLYICRYFELQDGVLAIADRFRSEDIPCDMIGLEPGWEDVPYRMGWNWSKERFPDPAGLVRELAQRGYAFELWESGDAPKHNYVDPGVRRNWYQKRVANSVAIGVQFFKQDDPFPRGIISEELQSPQLGDPLGSSSDVRKEEMYNLSNTLYSETALQEYRRITGKRGFYIFNGYNSSIASHRWPVTWAADFAAGCGMLSASLSGHGMVSFDMRNQTTAGIHHGFLTPFSIIDAWAYYREPWLWPAYLQDCHRLYAKLRNALAPYLYSSLWQANQSGVPMLRPMALDYGHDAEARNLTTQFMLGDWLLCGLEERVYLPAGTWIDYWTGASYVSAGQWVNCPFAEPAGGPLLVKAGAIMPMKPVSSFIEEEAAHLVVLDVYPDQKQTEYTLYEDDGQTCAYETGAYAATKMTCQQVGDAIRLMLSARQGDYEGKPAARTYVLCVHTATKPLTVDLNGAGLAEYAGSREVLLRDGAGRGWSFSAEDGTVYIKLDAGWYLASDARGAADPEQDTLIWTTAQPPAGDAGEIVLRLATTAAKSSLTRTARPYPLSPAPKPVETGTPDRLRVVANPPERIALKWGDWLAHTTNLYVSICAGEDIVPGATNVVCMDVLDAAGVVIRHEEKQAQRGRVEFLNVEHKPAEWTFRFSSDGLRPCAVVIRPEPYTPGLMFGPPPA